MIKKNMVQVFVCIELMVYAAFYYYGYQGVRQKEQMKQHNAQIVLQIDCLREEIATYNHEIAQWNLYAFYKEKIAREQLQMARSEDIIYYVH